jgi:ABC-type cobalamin/Fe3+-siderophores transport system ATPase subunit
MLSRKNTDILLLDESTTFLDLAHQAEIMDLVKHPKERRAE